MNNKHCLFGPSSLERRSLCPGSARMEKDLPEIQSDSANDGSEKHKQVRAAFLAGTHLDTREDDVQFCIDAVRHARDVAMAGTNAMLLCENKISMESVHPSITHGTFDCALISPYQRAWLYDFKFGHGDVTPAAENLQLQSEALAIMHYYDLQSVTICLIQAPTKTITTRVINQTEYIELRKKIRLIVDAALRDDAQLIPGTTQCKYCRAAATCPALLEKINNATIPTVPIEALSLREEAYAPLYDKWKLLQQWGGNFERHIYSKLIAGGTISGFAMRETMNNREYIDDRDRVCMTLVNLAKNNNGNADDVFQSEPKSPAQIEKRFGKSKKIEEALADIIVRKAGNPKLIRLKKSKHKEISE